MPGKQIAYGILGSMFHELMQGVGQKTGAVAGEVVSEAVMSLKEARAQTLALVAGPLVKRNEKAAQNLLRRQRMRQTRETRRYGDKSKYMPNDEDLMVNALSKLFQWIYDPEKHEESTEAILDLFEWLGLLSDKKFDHTIEWVHDDRILQWLNTIGVNLGRIRGWSKKEVAKLFRWILDKLPEPQEVLEFLKSVDKKLAEQIEQGEPVLASNIRKLDTYLSSKGW